MPSETNEARPTTPRRRSSLPVAARNLARRTSSRVWEERPRTPAGWTVLASTLGAAALGYEIQLQRKLTRPPLVFVQQHHGNDRMQQIYQKLMDGILGQPIQPSLWVGTRGSLASSLSMVHGIPESARCVRFSHVVTIPIDGAQIKLEWEVPGDTTTMQELFSRPIDKPVVLLLHGINNHSGAGYIRSLQRTLTNRGKIAVGFNMRGVGGVSLAAPRGYGGAYTGDIRYVVHYLSSLLGRDTPLLLVGFSLGANLVTKYLGEEGLSGTLPKCVVGGASLGNPMHVHSKNNLHFPFGQLIGQGIKLYVLEHWNVWKHSFDNPGVKRAFQKSLLAVTCADIDEAFAPIHLRNEPYYPFESKIGYEKVEDYWEDCSSYRYIQHVSVPLLAIIAGDDKVVYHTFQEKLGHAILNPNILAVETKCGGHLGWQESPPSSQSPSEDQFLGGPSWASRATADFIDALLEARQSSNPTSSTNTRGTMMHPWEQPPPAETFSKRRAMPVLQSRL